MHSHITVWYICMSFHEKSEQTSNNVFSFITKYSVLINIMVSTVLPTINEIFEILFLSLTILLDVFQLLVCEAASHFPTIFRVDYFGIFERLGNRKQNCHEAGVQTEVLI